MKKFLITVNGNQYEVDVEEISGGIESAVVQTNAAPAPVLSSTNANATPVQTSAPATTAVKPVIATAKKGSETIFCPMPGTILKVPVKPGQEVKKNQVLCVLEAMKMENEIVSPRDAIIADVMISKGSSMNAGDPLVSLE